jgi:hypothetical protein
LDIIKPSDRRDNGQLNAFSKRPKHPKSRNRRFGRKEGRRHCAGWDDEKAKDIPELKTK